MAKKTWKREYAALFVAVLLWQIHIGNTEMVEVIIWPLISFVAVAAGLQIYDRRFTSFATENNDTRSSSPAIDK